MWLKNVLQKTDMPHNLDSYILLPTFGGTM